MKKFVICIVSIILAISLLSGCGNGFMVTQHGKLVYHVFAKSVVIDTFLTAFKKALVS